jgi:hypothetical protein
MLRGSNTQSRSSDSECHATDHPVSPTEPWKCNSRRNIAPSATLADTELIITSKNALVPGRPPEVAPRLVLVLLPVLEAGLGGDMGVDLDALDKELTIAPNFSKYKQDGRAENMSCTTLP